MAGQWRAVERDLIVLDRDIQFDRGTLPLGKLCSIVLGAPPGSAVHHSRHGSVAIPAPARAPAPPRPTNPGVLDFDAMPLEDFERLRQANYATGPAPSRVIKPARVAKKG